MYSNFGDIRKGIIKLTLYYCWKIEIQNTLSIIICTSTEHILPKYEIFVDHSLEFSFRIYGWLLPDDRSFFKMMLTNFIFELSTSILWEGITTPDPYKEINYQKHIILKKINYHLFKQNSFQSQVHHDEYYRASNLRILILSNTNTNPCSYLFHIMLE